MTTPSSRQALWYAACMAKERNQNYMVVASKLARPRWVLRAAQFLEQHYYYYYFYYYYFYYYY